MHGLTGGSWKRNKDRTRATEMKDTRGNLAVTSGSETYRRCALPRQLSTLLPRRNRHKRPILTATKQGQQLDDAVAAYLRWERPPGLATPQCFVVLGGPTAGAPVSEAGLRSLFRRYRELSGATRVRPHRLRHTYGTELASAGIDLLALRALMGHVSPETTARYVHLSIEQLAAEYGAARATLAGTPR